MLREALERSPVVLLTGPRQAGKSTLAREVVAPARSHFFDLEDPRDLARLSEPTLALSGLSGTVVIDEAQYVPSLFPILRVLVDQDRRPGRFLVLGSASPELVGLSAQSLAGRVTFLELAGFTLGDVGSQHADPLWLRGGLPESFLAPTDEQSSRWRDDYIATFLQRDLAALGFGMSPTTMRRFWSMLAHYHGQTWNGAELARSLGLSQSTVRRYLDALTDALLVRQLQPWHANISQRQVKAPRVFIQDTGLLHRLLGITTMVDLRGHPKCGASWEGLVVEHVATRPDVDDASFWSTHSGAELDLRVLTGGRTIGIEVKLSETPTVTRSMRSAIESLDLDHLYVVHAGEHRLAMSSSVTAVPAREVLGNDTATETFS